MIFFHSLLQAWLNSDVLCYYTQIYISVTQFTFQVTCTAVDDIEVASTDKGAPLGTVIETKTVKNIL